MRAKNCYKIYLIGVGGQGTVKTATIIGEAAMTQGMNVLMSEVHGMAQRGGTVVTEMKIGKADSPLIEKNSADLVLAFEPTELLRVLNRIKKDTRVVVSSSAIVPFTVSLGISGYPDKNQMLDKLKQEIKNLYLMDTDKMANEAGHVITANIIILGAVTAIANFPVKRKFIEESIRKNLPAHTIKMNMKAFEMGYKEVISAFSVQNS